MKHVNDHEPTSRHTKASVLFVPNAVVIILFNDFWYLKKCDILFSTYSNNLHGDKFMSVVMPARKLAATPLVTPLLLHFYNC